MTDDEKQKRAQALDRIRKNADKPGSKMAFGLIGGMLASMDMDHDAEDRDLDEFLVALVKRQEEPTADVHLKFYMLMCKSFVGPALRRLAEAGRLRVVTDAEGRPSYLPALEEMQ